MVGINKNRSIQDEKLIEAIFNSGLIPPVSGKSHLIMDARPLANAIAQTAMGAGTESSDAYKNSKIVFLGIENIHVVRDSMNKLVDVVENSERNISLQSLEKTGWLKHLKSILAGVAMIVQVISNILIKFSMFMNTIVMFLFIVVMAGIVQHSFHHSLRYVLTLILGLYTDCKC
jgi:hypothetical protein